MRYTLACLLGAAASVFADTIFSHPIYENVVYNGPFQNKTFAAERLSTKLETLPRYSPRDIQFSSGVASGDPTDHSIIVWTRVNPHLGTQLVEDQVVCLEFALSKWGDMGDPVHKGTVFTEAEIDWTVKLDLNGLEARTLYYYQFKMCDSDRKSGVGKARTLPDINAEIQSNEYLRIGVYSNNNFSRTNFYAYKHNHLAKNQNIDLAVFLGNYIHESPEYPLERPVPQRNVDPKHELSTLEDYRLRYASYRTDPDLTYMHQQVSWITMWDEHEIVGGAWKEGAAHNTDREAFMKRKVAALRAYFEWMPIRQIDIDNEMRIWRSFKIGTLLDLIMIDSRHYGRDDPEIYGMSHDEIHNRTILGYDQEAFLFDELALSSKRQANWRIIAQNSVFSQMHRESFAKNSWDRYPGSRDRVLSFLEDNQINNTVILSGQAGMSLAFDLAKDNSTTYNKFTGEGSLGIELGNPGVNTVPISQNFDKWYINNDDEVQWAHNDGNGYMVLHIQQKHMTARYFTSDPEQDMRFPHNGQLAVMSIRNGDNKLHRHPWVGGENLNAGARRTSWR